MGAVHEALYYEGRDQLVGGLRRFVADGIRGRQPTLLALPAANLELARNALGSHADSVRLMDMAEVGRNPSRIMQVIRDWIDGHPGPVRFVGEPIWPGRTEDEVSEALIHEGLINDAIAGTDTVVLCPYDIRGLPRPAISGAERTHPIIRCKDSRRSSSYVEPSRNELLSRPLSPSPNRTDALNFRGDLGSSRRFVASSGAAAHLSWRRLQDLIFCVNEAATNLLKHGDGTGDVRIWHDDRSVVCEVSGAGEMRDPFAGRRRPDPDSPVGRGLWLVNQLCDLVQLRCIGSRLTIRMHVTAA
jgi:hypothetical protein